jgi:hypothetical protein
MISDHSPLNAHPMKKSSLVLLTIVAALTISSCAVQKTTENLGPPDPVYAEQTSDTTDTTRYHQNFTQAPQYNYYYRSYFWDDMYRVFFPQRYYTVISQPDYRPRHLRLVRGTYAQTGHLAPHSGRRGGFGRSGSAHTAHS